MQHHDPSTRLWTLSFISLTLCSFLLFLNLQMLLSAFPSYVKNELSGSDLSVSLVISVFAVSAMLTRFLTAGLMRRLNRNVILLVGVAAMAAITGIHTIAHSVESLLVMRICYGVSFGMASTVIPTLVSQIIPRARMGEGIGYFGLSSSLAMSIGPMIGLNVMKQSGFGMLSVISAATVLLIFPIMLISRSIPPIPVKEANAGARAAAVSTATTPSFSSRLLFPALLNVILSVTYSGLLSFIALYGESVHLEQVGLFFLFNAVTIIIIRPISGKIFDSRGHGAVLLPAALCVIASLLVLSYAADLPMLIVSALLYGLGFGAIQPTLQAWMLRLVPQEQHGTVNSLFYNSTDLGVAGGALILGAISTVTGYAAMYRYAAEFMVVFLLLYVGVRYFSARQARKAELAA
ncbi:MFS transporter [Paenibacillus oenotherae]|uniref:MFS transporter n=1 Tax=Paenibacillus oenotherae TaxID=1435645 RepID=A0ABS7D9H4_9BACL|nr:MFS transporter [Paenibacillus oenotherae]MBW7476439.1 MFS transporter [Paenibacillus oenotherae]